MGLEVRTGLWPCTVAAAKPRSCPGRPAQKRTGSPSAGPSFPHRVLTASQGGPYKGAPSLHECRVIPILPCRGRQRAAGHRGRRVCACRPRGKAEAPDCLPSGTHAWRAGEGRTLGARPQPQEYLCSRSACVSRRRHRRPRVTGTPTRSERRALPVPARAVQPRGPAPAVRTRALASSVRSEHAHSVRQALADTRDPEDFRATLQSRREGRRWRRMRRRQPRAAAAATPASARANGA